MKKHIALILAASTLGLAGCCTTHHAAIQWEYKVARSSSGIGPQADEQLLNESAKAGWVLVTKDGDLFYLKRPKQ
jgi:spermidine/putrescine-binding protein